MALTDIVIGISDDQQFEAEIPLGGLNAPVDILTETNSRAGIPESELVLFVETSSTFIF
jgi:hypothetical protein